MKIVVFFLALAFFVGVVTPVRNEFSECWSSCSRRNGWCTSYCGSGGLCCRQGYTGNGCDGTLGGKNHHRCTSDERGKSVRYRGKDCWSIGGCTSGSCSWCGSQGSCCRIGDSSGTGCDGKNGGDGHHRCTARLANYDRNWMSRVSGEKYLSQLTIPGTHDSCADDNISCGISTGHYKCQDKTVSQQLNLGVRFLDLRFKHKNNRFVINHADCELGYTFDGVLSTIRQFFQQNNQETIMVSYSYYPDEDEGNSRTFQATLDWYLSQNGNLFYNGASVPKLKDVRSKIVLVNFGRWEDQDEYGRTTGEHGLSRKWNSNTVHNNYDPWECLPTTGWGCGGYMDGLRGNMERSMTNQNNQLLYITYLSASTAYDPKSWANYVNSRIHNWILQQEGPSPAGIVVWDYVRDYHARLVYYMNL